MNCLRSCLLISCILLSGCTLKTGSRAHSSPTMVSSFGSSQSYAYKAPRNTVPSVHQPVVRQTPVTHFPQVALLSPRMQGFNGVNPAFQCPGASAAKANTAQPASPAEGVGDDNTIISQPADSKAGGQISDRQVVAANVFPELEPHYAAPIAVMIIIGALIYYALYRFAGSGQQIVEKKDTAGSPVTYHTNTQINYHYDSGGQKTGDTIIKTETDKSDR
ncbi:MAG TPA: hypothetical protein VNV43_10190 [Candidatus Acidoferrales bacterium]|nr:hypothetical protein [Candidatus Acidoferrales bacterium]